MYLRHSSRHALQSIIDYITDQLWLKGWTDPDNVPFGATPVAILDGFPDEWDEESVLDPGTLVVTLGDEDAAQEEELGPLTSIELPVFIDCYEDTDGITLALACDIRDMLTGRLTGSAKFLEVSDYNYSSPQPSGYQIEFEDVVRSRIKNRWHVVKVTANMFFNDFQEEEGGSS